MLDIAGSNEDELVVTLLVPPGSRSSSKIRGSLRPIRDTELEPTKERLQPDPL